MPDLDFFNNIEPLSIEEIASIAGCRIHANSNKNIRIKAAASIDSASSDNITFLSNPKYAGSLKESSAAACILKERDIAKAPPGMCLLLSDDPYVAYAKISAILHPNDTASGSISDKAIIDESAIIGDGCTIEAGAFIGANAKIGKKTFIASNAYINKGVTVGDNCYISNSVTLSHTIIGNDVIIHPGVRIGQDGFGFATEHGVHIKVPQLGRVIIKNSVEIGANTCIDRGAGPDTVIGEGTKIDNLVQIGHNVQTGKGCIIVSQVGISGSTKLGDYVVLGGQAGIAGHLNIGSMVSVAAQSGIGQDISPKEIVGGTPAVPIRQWHRQSIALKKLVTNKRLKNDRK